MANAIQHPEVVVGRSERTRSTAQSALALRPRADQVVFAVMLVVVALLVIPPLVMLVRTSLVVGETLGHQGTVSVRAYADILTARDFWQSVANTLAFAVGATVVGVGIGGILAWCTERTNAPFKRLVYTAGFVSFAVPGILRAIGWIFLIGPRTGLLNAAFRWLFHTNGTLFDAFTLPSMIVVEGLFWVPVVFLMLAATFHALDPSFEEAAAMSGASAVTTVVRVTLRLAWPGILSAALLTFIRSIQAFEVPLLLGVPGKVYTLPIQAFLAVQASLIPDYAPPSAYGVLLLGFLMLCIVLYSRWTGGANRYTTVTGKGYRPRVTDLGRGRTLAGAFILLIVVLQFLPVIYLAVASFLPSLDASAFAIGSLTLANYSAVFNSPDTARSVVDSLEIALVAATVVALLAGVAAWVLVRARVRGVALLDQLISLPLVFPGVIMGVAILVVYLRSPVHVYGTIWILVIAYVTSFLPFGIRYTHPAMLQLHPELEESAYLSGAGWIGMFRRVLAPLLLPALFAAWVFVFLISLRELSVAALLYTAHSPVIATTVLDLWQNGNVNQVSAFGALVAVLSIAVASVAYRVSGRWGIRM